MSNLGRYQEFVTAAKEVGGVDALLSVTEKAAVSKVAPKLITITAIATLLADRAARRATRTVQTKLEERAALQKEADAAREILRTADRVPTCAWCGAIGHDRRVCTVPGDATPCEFCGFPGHDGSDCPRGSDLG